MRSVQQLESELAARAAKYPNSRGATIGLRVFTRATAKAVAHSTHAPITWHTLADLYA